MKINKENAVNTTKNLGFPNGFEQDVQFDTSDWLVMPLCSALKILQKEETIRGPPVEDSLKEK